MQFEEESIGAHGEYKAVPEEENERGSGITQNRDVDVWEVLLLLKDRAARIGISHLEEISVRSNLIFAEAGVLLEMEPENNQNGKTAISDIVRNPTHPLRVIAPPGPMVAWLPGSAAVHRSIASTTDLLLSENSVERAAAVAHIEALPVAPVPLLTQRTRSVLTHRRDELLAGEGTAWRGAALEVHAATEDDWLYSLAGLRQALGLQYHNGIDMFLRRLLRPSVSSIDSIALTFWDPFEQRTQIEAAIMGIVQQYTDLTAALDAYWRDFGHVPLTPRLGMSRVVTEWLLSHETNADVWSVLWEWADGMGSPVARYHALQAILDVPVAVPEGQRERVWDEVAIVYGKANRKDKTGERQIAAWDLRAEIAAHFCYHFACHLPWSQGERIATLSWWLTERIASLFEGRLEQIEFLRTQVTTPEANASKMLFVSLHPNLSPSALFYATVSPRRVWARALTGQLGVSLIRENFSPLPSPMEESTRQRIGIGLMQDLVHDPCPLGMWKQGTDGYGFSLPSSPAVEGWVRHFSDNYSSDLAKLPGTIADVCDGVSTSALVNLIVAAQDDKSVIAAFRLHVLCYADAVATEEMVAVLEKEEAIGQAIQECKNEVFELLMDALTEIAVKREGKLRILLPHVFAVACSRSTDQERRDSLFIATVFSSAAMDTVSAIRRLLTGERRGQYLELSNAIRQRLSEISSATTAWGASRLRPVLAALRP